MDSIQKEPKQSSLEQDDTDTSLKKNLQELFDESYEEVDLKDKEARMKRTHF